ncbi:hypothetical protein IY145_07580 [Methylosinus sp. H3A]|uniref:lysozyme inhibitor LprI family protein n=1 Tax=Methylosinus sp. H3A TaxID=2785786 RepID=UPI0018C21232|nr:lysozyme inhibitor LprI family protein [Methylosinus sp. H3A]MBG0809235.1 hypothetical protein [Methylosinus sp. H3A]
MIRVLLLLALSLTAIPALAQSFDCAKARTPVERLVCADRRLGALDTELGAEAKKALAADPARRGEKLAEARKWLGERDHLCPLPAGELHGEARAKALACLTSAYETRLAALKSAPAPARSPEATAVCRKLAERYRATLAENPEAPFKSSFYAAGPLNVLAAAPHAGVELAAPAAEISEVSRRKLADWAKGRPQLFVFPDKLAADLVEIAGSSQLTIDRLPNENFYAASVIEGTARCYSAAYFTVARGHAQSARGPANWEGESGDGCGVSRSFGTLDGASVALEEAHGYSPSLSSTVSAAPWRGGEFGPACDATFEFAPRFAERASYNDWDEHCEGADCEALRKAALALVEAAQKQPLEARKSALARLTTPQAAEFTELEKLAEPMKDAPRDPAEAADPAFYDENGPLRLPFVHGGRLYLAELGHFTIGWRIFADWRVALKRPEKGKLEESAVFAIGMTKGALRDVSIK